MFQTKKSQHATKLFTLVDKIIKWMGLVLWQIYRWSRGISIESNHSLKREGVDGGRFVVAGDDSICHSYETTTSATPAKWMIVGDTGGIAQWSHHLCTLDS